jgi:L-ascorbate metabolism protein UlaG (beta-lactamase superfamily)
MMKIKWYGHASFLITSDRGVKIITDPYEPGFMGQLNYEKIGDSADIVLVTHDHGDHNHTATLPGSPQVVKGTGPKTVRGIPIKGISAFHDRSKGSERGVNTIFAFNVDGVHICHLGDLGHILNEKELANIGPVDLLLIPVGGYFTIDAGEATRVAEQVKPRILIPMHFKTEKCGFPISPVDDFLKGKPVVKRLGLSEATIDKSSLPRATEILVLEHAL